MNLEVSEEQSSFVTNNTFSVLQSHYDTRNFSIGIYNGEEMVGFMIDKDCQGKGYGKMALLQLIRLISDQHSSNKLYTSVKPRNNHAKKLYESVGFRNTGEMRWEEEILVVDL